MKKDKRCIAALAQLVQHAEGRLEVIEGDALDIDLTTLAKALRAIVANLPYNIGTELLIGWLKQIAAVVVATWQASQSAGAEQSRQKNDAFKSLTLMFQAEVADRLMAAPGNKTYGRLSVIAQFCCDIKRVMNVPARAFVPPPKVDSAIVHLTPHKKRIKDVPIETLERVTAAAFGQRRKMLRSSLKPLGGEELLNRAGINPELRAENLSVKQFADLASLASSIR